ncbi:MAG: peptide deformylase [Gemmatimonadales bacterium]|nr:MAG: peptide deformylase [Gemmatimonadales bacterium]
MPALPILQYPDPRLRLVSAPVDRFDQELLRRIDELFETLYATTGIGLSAPQVGDLRRIVVMDLSGSHSKPELYVNPEILSSDVMGLVEESCLSIPGVVGNVVRATKLRVRAVDRAGHPFERDLEGMHAVCMQHEVDHLDGKLFIDKLPMIRRLAIRTSAAFKGTPEPVRPSPTAPSRAPSRRPAQEDGRELDGGAQPAPG